MEEEVLNTLQGRPGDETQFMHAIFSSDEEMLAFYLTLNRFMNPGSYMIERSDRKRLKDLQKVLYNNVPAFEALYDYKSISLKEVVKGLGVQMMDTHVSNFHRLQNAESVNFLIDCVLNTIKNYWVYKQMKRVDRLHLENV